MTIPKDFSGRYLCTKEAARVLGLSFRTLEKHRVYGTGPQFLKLGGRVVYKIEDLHSWASRLKLCALAKTFLKIAKPNEAETEREFIYPVIEALGWTDYQVQQILSQKGRKQVPDALLFPNSDSKTLAVAEAQQWKRFQYGSAVLEAKRWGRALDRADKRDPSEEGVPSTQMLQYLSRVDVQTNNKVRLGMLEGSNRSRVADIAAS